MDKILSIRKNYQLFSLFVEIKNHEECSRTDIVNAAINKALDDRKKGILNWNAIASGKTPAPSVYIDSDEFPGFIQLRVDEDKYRDIVEQMKEDFNLEKKSPASFVVKLLLINYLQFLESKGVEITKKSEDSDIPKEKRINEFKKLCPEDKLDAIYELLLDKNIDNIGMRETNSRNSLKEIDIIKNRLTNLIPIINPELKDEYGIKAAILYRVSPSAIEIDSCEMVRVAYKRRYGDDIPESADTIFNAFIPFLDFCRAKLFLLKKYKIPSVQKDLLLLIYEHLDEIFEGYTDLRALFDRYFELMYSFSNLMPVPKYFNGSQNRAGKGSWNLNKDYPSIYYDNLKDSESGIENRETMKSWLDSVMELYKIKDMYQLRPPYPINEFYGYNDDKLDVLMSFIKRAIRLIEDRFE